MKTNKIDPETFKISTPKINRMNDHDPLNMKSFLEARDKLNAELEKGKITPRQYTERTNVLREELYRNWIKGELNP